jgi:hypothetical protein
LNFKEGEKNEEGSSKEKESRKEKEVVLQQFRREDRDEEAALSGLFLLASQIPLQGMHIP